MFASKDMCNSKIHEDKKPFRILLILQKALICQSRDATMLTDSFHGHDASEVQRRKGSCQATMSKHAGVETELSELSQN